MKNLPRGIAPEFSLPQAMPCRNKFAAILLRAAALADFFCCHPVHFATHGQLLACQCCWSANSKWRAWAHTYNSGSKPKQNWETQKAEKEKNILITSKLISFFWFGHLQCLWLVKLVCTFLVHSNSIAAKINTHSISFTVEWGKMFFWIIHTTPSYNSGYFSLFSKPAFLNLCPSTSPLSHNTHEEARKHAPWRLGGEGPSWWCVLSSMAFWAKFHLGEKKDN